MTHLTLNPNEAHATTIKHTAAYIINMCMHAYIHTQATCTSSINNLEVIMTDYYLVEANAAPSISIITNGPSLQSRRPPEVHL